jgi:cysteine desulfurase/selenocysteine lyase
MSVTLNLPSRSKKIRTEQEPQTASTRPTRHDMMVPLARGIQNKLTRLSNLHLTPMAPFLPMSCFAALSLFSATSSSDPLLNVAAKIIHLNHAGASPSPNTVLERVVEHLYLEQRIGGYAAAAAVQEELGEVYRQVATFLHASVEEIALVESATVAWTRIFYAAAAHMQYHSSSPTRRVILVSEAEYVANLVAACQWAKRTKGWTVLTIPSERDADDYTTGKIDLRVFQEMLQGQYSLGEKFLDPSQIAMVCVTQIPTNSGIANPVEEIGTMIAKYNSRIFYLVDACQAVGQKDVNVQHMQCDALVGTGRKYLRGPRGTGFLYVNKDFLCSTDKDDIVWPHHVDHNGVPVTSVPSSGANNRPVEDILEFAPLSTASRFEFWESNIAGKLGLGEAVRAASEMGIDLISGTIQSRATELFDRLDRMELVHTHHAPESGIVTFSVEGIPAATLKEGLWNDVDGTQFDVSVVPATSTPLDSSSANVPDLLRASVSYTTTAEEIILFCARLRDLLSVVTKAPTT